MQNIVVLEQWRKCGYTNRLVSDGNRIWLEYLSNWNVNPEQWHEDPAFQDYWLKVFK